MSGLRRRDDAGGVVVPLPRRIADGRLDLARLLPSARSLLIAFGLVIGVFAAYWGARASSLFAVQHVEVRGAPASVSRQVETALQGTVGRSLLSIDADQVEASLRALPSVAAASVDRAFPHTLVVMVAPARPVAVVRSGHTAWLVTGENLVIREVEPSSYGGLPRLWVPTDVSIHVGGLLPSAYVSGTRALAALQDVHFRGRVTTVQTKGDLTLVLRSGLWVELGDDSDLRLKLAIADRVLPLLDSSAAYLDVSVPERPVSGTDLKSQVEVDSSPIARP